MCSSDSFFVVRKQELQEEVERQWTDERVQDGLDVYGGHVKLTMPLCAAG